MTNIVLLQEIHVATKVEKTLNDANIKEQKFFLGIH